MNLNQTTIKRGFAALITAIMALNADAASTPSRTEASSALRKSVDFFQSEVGYRGAYLWRFSSDLKKQEGEGKAHRTSGWTQAPGTPYVGEAYLEAFRLTGDSYLLEAAQQAAYALVASQLRSGGWGSRFELGVEQRGNYAYRTEPESGKRRNYTTLDDNKSQSCLMLLMHMDEELEFRDKRIHEALAYALDRFLKAQYPNGAWPQQFREPPDSATHPIKRADYPATWSRTFPNQTYKGHYTFNDNAMVDMMNVLFEAQRIYGDDRYRRAAEKTGGFLLLAQMPEPQPGWAQQYNADMAPAWARKFEPASVGGGEAQSVMFALIQLYRMTGDKKYLEPIPRALAYYKRSQRPDGKLARFYELKTNKPLYFTKDYQLTYSDADMPTHYGFVVSSRLGKIEREYEDALKTPKDQLDPPRKKDDYKMSSDLMKRARAAIDIMDSRGAWVEMGKLRYHGSDDKTREIIDTRTVVKNILTLAQFISASKQPSP